MENNGNTAVRSRFRSVLAHHFSKELFEVPEDFELALILRTPYYANITILNKKDARYGKTLVVPMYKDTSLVKLFRKTPKTIRQYQRDGVIPAPKHKIAYLGREQPVYTFDEMKQITKVLPLIVVGDRRGIAYSAFSKALHLAFAAMPDGIIVEPK